MSKHVIILGAGKSATHLIDYLKQECVANNWYLTVADNDLLLARQKTGICSHARAVKLAVEQTSERSALISTGDLIISLLPPHLHYLVAVDCLAYKKNLLTASYIDDNIRQLRAEISSNNLLFLCEMGLDPGIDHMSAMRLFDDVKAKGGRVTTFRSHCGGLVAPESDDNPWHYKISWNPLNIVMAGTGGAVYIENGQRQQKKYTELFSECKVIDIPGLGNLAYYPNRDSLAYMPVYGLPDATTFIRTTLRHPRFCTAWNAIVQAGLAERGIAPGTENITFRKWSEKVIPFINDENKEQLAFLGLFDDQPVPVTARRSAEVLQYLLEKNMMMRPGDRDMVVMYHEIGFEQHSKLYQVNSKLVVTGENDVHTAMSKTVGLPLGIAASLVLKDKIHAKGLHIPVLRDIYEPVLRELAKEGIVFHETNPEATDYL